MMQITIGHGGGGKLTRDLLEEMILPVFDNDALRERHDGAVIDGGDGKIAFTTDTYVVTPLFFPGGDIGSLAVHGTVNDLAMCGARPLHLSAALVMEEGLPLDDLERIVRSMQEAARVSGVSIVTGDTKVVDRGKGDGIFINTAGIGRVMMDVSPSRVREGDVVILNGDVGRHGVTILAAREDLALEGEIASDSAPLVEPVLRLHEAGLQVHCLRDLTRGGLATAVIEIARTAGVRIDLDEEAIPVREDVRGACELLGLDPLYVANEGRFIAFVPQGDAERVGDGRVIGRVVPGRAGTVTARTSLGTRRVLDLLSGDQLPRIC